MQQQPQELTPDQIAEMAKDPEIAQALEDVKKAVKDRPKKKKKEEGPTDEEIRSAVAGVVLAELEMWPEEVQSLIGEDHPQKDSFIKGVPYIIGAYMHIAREKLERTTKQMLKDKEIETAKALGPISQQIKTVRQEFSVAQQEALAECNRAEQEEAKKAAQEIAAKYRAKRQEISEKAEPEELQDLRLKQQELEEGFDQVVLAVSAQRDSLLGLLNEIDMQKDDWNSKKRKGRRRHHVEEKTGKKSGQPKKK